MEDVCRFIIVPNSEATMCFFMRLGRHGNSLGFDLKDRQSFIEKNQLPFYDGRQEYCLWLGCMAHTIRGAARLFSR